jgi:hypothetical protein
MTGDHSDIDRISEVIDHLMGTIAESERVRERIRGLARQRPIWPDRRTHSRFDEVLRDFRESDDAESEPAA